MSVIKAARRLVCLAVFLSASLVDAQSTADTIAYPDTCVARLLLIEKRLKYMDNDVFSLEEHLSAVNRKNAAKGWIKLGAGIAGLTATILDTYLKHGCYLTYATPTLNSRGYISGTKDTTSYYRYDTDWSYLHTAMAILSASIVVSGTFDIVIPKKRYQKREWAY